MSRLLTGTLLTLAGGAAALWLKGRRDEPDIDARTHARLAPRTASGGSASA
jgi:hypothetical protein